jgi:hypothetical protein
VLAVGLGRDHALNCAKALCGAVALLCNGIGTVNLLQHGIIGVFTEYRVHGREIGAMSIAGDLNAISETPAKIINKQQRVISVALSNKRRDQQFGVGANGSPGPCIASICGSGLGLPHVVVLRIHKRPNFIELHALAGEIVKGAILIFGAGAANVL